MVCGNTPGVAESAVRVLHVSSYFAPAFSYGGPPRTILGLCAALQEAGVGVEVFTTTANGEGEFPASPPEGSLVDGLRVHYFPRRAPRRVFGVSGMREALQRYVRFFQIVHVHGLWNIPGWLAIEACRGQRIPYVVSPRGMLDAGSFAHHRLRKTVCYWLRERQNLRSASFLHATSSGESASIRRLGLDSDVVTIPNGIDPPETVPGGFRQKLGIPENARLVTFLGRLHPTKRLDLLVQAFRRLHRKVPDALLVLAGRPDGLDVCSLGLDESMRWLGPLEEREKWALLFESNALVMCSDSESFGMSVLEALSVGVPVVATRTCPWEEIQAHGCGFWVDQQAESIAAGIEQILGDAALARRMGEKGRQLVATRYRWPAIGRLMMKKYQSLLALPRDADR